MEYIALVEQSRNKTRETVQEKPAKPQKRLTTKLIFKQDKPENWTDQQSYVENEQAEAAE